MFYYIVVFHLLQSQFDNFNIAKNKYKILEMAVNLALDRHDPQRELTSQLIADLNGSVMSKTDIGQGFDELLANLSDLTLDTPEAPTASCRKYSILLAERVKNVK